MNRRQRKKYKKKIGTWVNPRDIWNLDLTIAEFVIPRLKEFKERTNGYPGAEPFDTFERWMEALDKMIYAWEIVRDWDKICDQVFDEYGIKNSLTAMKPYMEAKNEGMELFTKYIQFLWW